MAHQVELKDLQIILELALTLSMCEMVHQTPVLGLLNQQDVFQSDQAHLNSHSHELWNGQVTGLERIH